MRIFSIVLFLIFNFSFGQTYRFFYDVTFKRDSAGTSVSKDLLVLDINKNNNHFYSYEYIKQDSLNNRQGAKFGFAYPKFTPILNWNKKNFTFIRNRGAKGYKYDDKIKLEWKFDDEKKEINGYSVQKATTTYGGRNWIAWFTTDIPFQYGPYVFYGLPGLVLEVYDDQDNYHFTFAGNKNLSENFDSEKFLEPYMSLPAVKINKKDWSKILLNEYHSPLAIYKTDEGMIVKSNGEPKTLKEILDDEKIIQARMRRYNNPIELDQKVNYPEQK